MPVIVNKIAKMEKDLSVLREEFDNFRNYVEQRFKKFESISTKLIEKMDELGNTFDAAFSDGLTDIAEANETSAAVEQALEGNTSQVEFGEDGHCLVPGKLREEYESKGYTIVGTVSRGTDIFLKMRQR